MSKIHIGLCIILTHLGFCMMKYTNCKISQIGTEYRGKQSISQAGKQTRLTDFSKLTIAFLMRRRRMNLMQLKSIPKTDCISFLVLCVNVPFVAPASLHGF